MSYPLVSIVIPVYNKEDYLNKAISSVINQSYKNIEFIVINDGSTDNSPSIIEEWTKKDDRIIYIKQENKGVSFTRNKGMDLATGDYIFFFDADDYLDRDAIKNLVDIARNKNYDIVAANFSKVMNGRVVKMAPLVEGFYASNNLDQAQVKANMFLLNGRPLATVCNKLYNKAFLKKSKVRFSDDVLAEDRLFNLMCFVHKPNIYVTNTYTYFYNIIEESRSRTYSPTLYQSIIKLYSVFGEYIAEEKSNIDVNELLVLNISYDMDNIIKYEIDYGKIIVKSISNKLKEMYEINTINKALQNSNINKIYKDLDYKKITLLRMCIFLNLFKYENFVFLTILSLSYQKLINIIINNRILKRMMLV